MRKSPHKNLKSEKGYFWRKNNINNVRIGYPVKISNRTNTMNELVNYDDVMYLLNHTIWSFHDLITLSQTKWFDSEITSPITRRLCLPKYLFQANQQEEGIYVKFYNIFLHYSWRLFRLLMLSFLLYQLYCKLNTVSFYSILLLYSWRLN